MRTKISAIKQAPNQGMELIGQIVTIKGWVRTVRDQKNFSFVEMNDGSTFSNLQVVLHDTLPSYADIIKNLQTGASAAITGMLIESPGKNQAIEMQAHAVEIIGLCDVSTYPLQKKRHSLEFLRSIAHLRPRTNTIGAMTRVRNALAFGTHKFFQDRGFLYIQTPLITAADCEGAGEMFRVTTLLDQPQIPRTAEGQIDFSKDFFGQATYLTVSGQLNAESYASALSDVYTFGPTFRAENSHTSRHLAEFWMMEPEMAFADLNDDMDCAESYLQYVVQYALQHCAEDLQFFDQWVEKGLLEKLRNIVAAPFARITYTEAVEILQQANKKFEYPISWGANLQSEHERYLAEKHFKKPVIVSNYPKEIKAFYMRLNGDDKTVAAMDVLFPGIGEIIGGSQREERLDILQKRMEEMDVPQEKLGWYLDLRKYGSVPHAGFGLGFERLVRFVTGIENIRDAIAFPRYPGNAIF